jgi:hypothetical protein
MKAAALALYGAGVLVGLWRTDARWPERIPIALLWPVGPLAFVVTMTGLLSLALVRAPALGAVTLAAVAGWWLMR